MRSVSLTEATYSGAEVGYTWDVPSMSRMWSTTTSESCSFHMRIASAVCGHAFRLTSSVSS
ncbi:MAG: hypothetical protein FJ087_03190 [Deltaproteobacteria bacterium]|nr:hypothetical protein [Deltaproteobacteria bacterium]